MYVYSSQEMYTVRRPTVGIARQPTYFVQKPFDNHWLCPLDWIHFDVWSVACQAKNLQNFRKYFVIDYILEFWNQFDISFLTACTPNPGKWMIWFPLPLILLKIWKALGFIQGKIILMRKKKKNNTHIYISASTTYILAEASPPNWNIL